MKILINYSLLIALTFLSYNTSFAQFKKVKGNGNITNKIHTTSDYQKVELVGFMDIILEKGIEGTIRVKTDENIQEHVIIESDKGVLKIIIKNNVNINTKNGIDNSKYAVTTFSIRLIMLVLFLLFHFFDNSGNNIKLIVL